MPEERTIPAVRWTWALIIIAAILAFSFGLAHEDFWYDETYSAAMAEHDILQIVQLTTHDFHPPLYYLLLRGVRLVIGNSDWALRLLSVWGAVALVCLGAGPIRRAVGPSAAIAYAVLLLFTPAALIYAHEARMYIWAAFAVMASATYGFLAARDNKAWDWVLFTCSSVAASYLQYYCVIAVFQVYLFLGVWLLRKNPRRLKPLLLTAGCVIMAYLPWVFFLAAQAVKVRSAFWISYFNGLAVLAAYVTPFSYKELYPGVTWSAALLGALLPAVTIIGGLLAARKAPGDALFILLGLVVFNGTLFTALYISTVFAPVYVPRYIITCFAPPLAAFALALQHLPGAFLRRGIIGLYVILNLFVLKDVYTLRYNGPNREMVRDLQDRIGQGELIITSDDRAMGPVFHYFPASRHLFFTGDRPAWLKQFKAFEPKLMYADRLPDILPSITSLWIIVSDARIAIPERQIAKELGPDWRRMDGPRLYSSPLYKFVLKASHYERCGQERGEREDRLTPKREAFVADRRCFIWIDWVNDVRWQETTR